ncbi:MAG TPA: MarR family transcriptional regulator [Gemmatimonadaceae bacterium]|nr:MarR family transcriptional regulator [Gemmatimonadaceae bacterium]
MISELRTELKQNKPFPSLHEEASLNIQRTAGVLGDEFAPVLKPYGITGTQYNVLRILRGAEPDGLCRNEVRERLINKMPDATRLLDRMEAAGLVTRSREEEDRRMVRTRITTQGREIVDALDAPVGARHKQQLGHLSADELKTLVNLLTKARNPG